LTPSITCDSNRVVLNAVAHIKTMTCAHFVQIRTGKVMQFNFKTVLFLLFAGLSQTHRLNVDGFNYWHDDGWNICSKQRKKIIVEIVMREL